MREGDTAVRVCVACALLGCLWVWHRAGGGGGFVTWCSRGRQGGSRCLTLSLLGE